MHAAYITADAAAAETGGSKTASGTAPESPPPQAARNYSLRLAAVLSTWPRRIQSTVTGELTGPNEPNAKW